MWAEEVIMEKTKKRALRRYHNDRMLKRAQKMILVWYWPPNTADSKEIYQSARRRRDNMQICSCTGCGNPRHGIWSGRRERMTMPEIKAEDSFKDQLAEYYMTLEQPDNEE